MLSLLQILRQVPEIETYLVMSSAAGQTIALETDYTAREVEALADHLYRFKDIAASISSGSFRTAGMVVVPCSMKTLAGITLSYSDNLLLRAADVMLKDRRRLVLVTRETPLHLGHLRHMVQVTEMGTIVLPPAAVAASERRQTVNRILDIFEIELAADLFRRWTGPEKKPVLVQERTTLATPAGDRNSGQRH